MRSLLTLTHGLLRPARADALRPEDFKRVYDLHQAHVRKTIYWMAGEEALDDLVQEVFIRVWKKLPEFRGESALRTWIHRVSVNVANDYLRRKQVDSSTLVSGLEAAGEEAAPDPDHATRAVIREGVMQLELKHREVFVLFYFQGLSIEEIAEALRLPAGTVKSRLHYGRNAFVEHLQKNGVEYGSE